MNKKVLIAMSGGVDSSVAAYLLKNIGYKVEGIFIKNCNFYKKENCKNNYDLLDVKFISNILNIKLHIVDISNQYFNKVFKNFLLEYRLGKTPNPDILCNKYIKFNFLINFANKVNANFISTGHYSRIFFNKNKYFLLKGIDENKDQSYFLCNLKQKHLKMCIFPLGTFKKIYIRKIAKKLNFINYNKKGSTGICFINNESFEKFISKFIKEKNGKILTDNNEYIGNHKGLHFYTIGQRKGINIGGKKNFISKPWFVIDKNIKNNTLYISQNINNKNLLSKGLIANYTNWIGYIPKSSKIESSIKIRYSNYTIPSTVYIINKKKILIIFKKKHGVVSPGQSVVLYIKNFCIGGSIIEKSIY